MLLYCSNFRRRSSRQSLADGLQAAAVHAVAFDQDLASLHRLRDIKLAADQRTEGGGMNVKNGACSARSRRRRSPPRDRHAPTISHWPPPGPSTCIPRCGNSPISLPDSHLP